MLFRSVSQSRYRGEIIIVHRKMNRHSPYYCNVGGKVAQLLIRRRERIVWEEVESLEDLGKSDRGDNGFGSTDKINKDGSMTGEYRLGNHRGNE